MQSIETNIDVIIPVFNEEEMISTFYRRITSLPLKLNLIFIDNASTDSTLEQLKNFEDISIIEHKFNEGYGGSIIDGIKHSTGDIIVIIDADCEYPPESIPIMIEELKKHEVVYGSRFLIEQRVDMSFLRMIGNKIITKMFNLLYKQNTTDFYTGCKAFKRVVLEGVTLERKGFEHVLELGAKFARKGIHIHEISIDYTPRSTGQSKMKHVSETIKFLYYLFVYNFLPSTSVPK